MVACIQPATAECLFALNNPSVLLSHQNGPLGYIAAFAKGAQHVETSDRECDQLVEAAEKLGISAVDYMDLQRLLRAEDAPEKTAAKLLDLLVAHTNALLTDPDKSFQCDVDEESAMGQYFNQLWFGYRAAVALANQLPDGPAKLKGNALWMLEDAQDVMDVIEQKTVDFIARHPSYTKPILMNVVREDSSRLRDELPGGWADRVKRTRPDTREVG